MALSFRGQDLSHTLPSTDFVRKGHHTMRHRLFEKGYVNGSSGVLLEPNKIFALDFGIGVNIYVVGVAR